MLIREATDEDWSSIWPFLREIVRAGETFSYDRDLTEEEAQATWLLAPPSRTVVALDDDGSVVGTANMHPNWGGPAAHVASANFMVDPGHRGQGVGRALIEYALAWARREGYRAMLFNAVAETNGPAIALYRSVGFELLATVPEGFDHPRQGYVGLHVMFRRL